MNSLGQLLEQLEDRQGGRQLLGVFQGGLQGGAEANFVLSEKGVVVGLESGQEPLAKQL